ncbi:hypothetical protein CONLIGDRAFT_630548 [Coniochaeta ligniaria NRRL 30616]|uniref:Uncharacterized protein n=1 Tax=Coniochaeta ligniaria NRRL 30616 TaxID=1408157 RepID=A0A1J7JL60_9PEZI|nr:hypothetical protein CONLIGDRAFT_630548 [Coniochaeta ligniaria NRRL 30616]
MEPGMSQDRDPGSQHLIYSQQHELPDTMDHHNDEQQIASLNMKVAVLLNKEENAVSFLSVAQCHTVINTLKRMQQARDNEIIQMLKPFIDSLDELILRLKAWKRLCHESGPYHPHAELIFKLEQLVNTELGMKPGSFELEGDILLAIEASNKILRALAVEKKYVGLSKPMSLLKHNVKQTMVDIQRFLNFIIAAHEPVPGARFRPSDALDATKGQVIVWKGRPFYIDPVDDDIVVCGPKHPMLKVPGSEWNKWFKLNPENCPPAHMERINFPDGAFHEFRERLREAHHVEYDNMAARGFALQDGLFYNAQQEAHFVKYKNRKNKGKSTNEQNEHVIDFEHAENLDWDMVTYLKMLDHKEIDYTLAPADSEEDYGPGFWWAVIPGSDVINFLHPGYRQGFAITNERIDHPCDFKIFKELEVDFSKMRMEPIEANGALTPYLYEDAATGDDFENAPEEVQHIPLGPFLREGLYLDARRDIMRIKGFNFVKPEFRRLY